MPKRTRKARRKYDSEVVSNTSFSEMNNEEVVKKAARLKDFDMRVETTITELETNKNGIIGILDHVFTQQKFLVKKDIRKMKVSEFLAKGGDLNTLDFTAVIAPLCGNADVSFQTEAKQPTSGLPFKKPPPVSAAKRAFGRQAVQQSPLVKDAPLTRSKGRSLRKAGVDMFDGGVRKGQQNPLITPKFDLRRPLCTAREPKTGETLVSLAGSPVVQSKTDDNESIGAIYLNRKNTIIGGSVFDTTSSPNTRVANKERLKEVLGTITSKLEDLEMQIMEDTKRDT